MQVMVIPISEGSVGYAQKVRATLRAARLHVEVDASDKKMQKKVREAQLAQFNYILVRRPLSHPPLSPHVQACPHRASFTVRLMTSEAAALLGCCVSDCTLLRRRASG